ncbi:MAG TPA: helix-turn-helix transcriptional regulator [Gammaproteobacteria bacterium]|nr:helix-turn-helix transcriptional regulator [Gammaproteobacteria bacterium]
MSENIFAKRLQERRRALDLSQEGLAKKAKLQSTAVSHFETGGRKPSFDNLRHLADALETTVDYLMGRTDSHSVALASGDQLYRDYEKLSARDREHAREMMASLARRAEREHET